MRLKKRGTITLFTIIEVAVGIGFALVLLNYAYEKGKGIDFERVYLSKDIALTIDALHGVSGNALVDYENSYMQQFKQQYDIQIANSIVGVSEQKTPDLRSTYPYGQVDAYPIDILLKAPSYLAFILKNRRIEISVTASSSGATGCSQIDTSAEISRQALLFEPGHYGKDKGNIAGSLEEYKLTKQIADNLKMLCTAKGYDCRLVQQQDLDSKISEIKDTQKNMFISIHIGSSASGSNPSTISFRTGDEKSSKLSCLIANKLRGNFDPVNTKQIDMKNIGENDDLKVIEAALPNPSLSIEIGNIDRKDFFNDPNNIANAAASILEGIEEYYAQKE